MTVSPVDAAARRGAEMAALPVADLVMTLVEDGSTIEYLRALVFELAEANRVIALCASDTTAPDLAQEIEFLKAGHAAEVERLTRERDQARAVLRRSPIEMEAALAVAEDALAVREAELEQARDRAVCSGCGSDVAEGGWCLAECGDGEMIPASELPHALRQMRDERDELRAAVPDGPVSEGDDG